MPGRTRSSDGNDDDILSQLVASVVEIAAKSASSSTDSARAVRALEGKVDTLRSDVTAGKTDIQALIARVSAMEASVNSLVSTSQRGVPQAFADAIRNPQTLLILAVLVASMLGLRLTFPAVVPTPPAVVEEVP